jgi:hypothetical protein
LQEAKTTALQVDSRTYAYETRNGDDALIVALNINDSPMRLPVASLIGGPAQLVGGTAAPPEVRPFRIETLARRDRSCAVATISIPALHSSHRGRIGRPTNGKPRRPEPHLDSGDGRARIVHDDPAERTAISGPILNSMRRLVSGSVESDLPTECAPSRVT